MKQGLAVLLTFLIACPPGYAQPSTAVPAHKHVAPPTVRGSEHPERISDQRAWLMRLIAMTSSPSTSEQGKQNAGIHRWTSGFGIAAAELDHFRARNDKLTSDYNKQWAEPSRVAGTNPLQRGAQLQLYRDLDQLVADTVAQIQPKFSPEQWKAINDYVQQEKRKMAFSDDGGIDPASLEAKNASPFLSAIYHPGDARLVRIQSVTFNQESMDGYTTYTTLDSTGSNWYQTVYLIGASAV